MSRITWLVFVACIVLTAVSAEGAGPALIEFEVDRVKYAGRLESRTSSQCWLMDRTGKLTELELAKIRNVKRVSSRFLPLTSTMLSSKLKREFGKQMEVRSTRHYLVAAPKGKAKGYAALFEEIYRSFYMHFSVRGFKVQDPEFPLVAIVFPDHGAFARYAKQDEVDARPGLMGYYMRTTNRVALFEGESPRKSSGNVIFNGAKSDKVAPILNGHSWGAIEGGLRDTMIHEATHQVAFNVGLHARIGQNPKWIVEGLATVFESDGIRNSSKGRQLKYRINRDRFVWFQNYAKTRHKSGALESFIRNDSMFKSQTLDAYAFSWALSFFLIETRPRQYSNLLKQLGSRDPLSPLSEDERVAMFKKTISSNLKLMEAEMLRFFNRIK